MHLLPAGKIMFNVLFCRNSIVCDWAIQSGWNDRVGTGQTYIRKTSIKRRVQNKRGVSNKHRGLSAIQSGQSVSHTL